MGDRLAVAIRFALYADLMLLFGLSLMATYLPGGRCGWGAGRGAAIWFTVVGLVTSFLSVVAMTASMAGVPLIGVDATTLQSMIFETPMGTAWMVRMVALVGVGSASIARPRSIVPRVVLAAIALASLAWTGHGAAGDGNPGRIQLVADIAHLLAAGAWIGAIAQLAIMVIASADTTQTHRALESFAGAGTVIVSLVVASGLINANYLIGLNGWDEAVKSPYGMLFLLKIILFVAMLGVAAANRFRLTPALGKLIGSDRAYSTYRLLRLSLILELSLAVVILALVAWLGTLEPPISM